MRACWPEAAVVARCLTQVHVATYASMYSLRRHMYTCMIMHSWFCTQEHVCMHIYVHIHIYRERDLHIYMSLYHCTHTSPYVSMLFTCQLTDCLSFIVHFVVIYFCKQVNTQIYVYIYMYIYIYNSIYVLHIYIYISVLVFLFMCTVYMNRPRSPTAMEHWNSRHEGVALYPWP